MARLNISIPRDVYEATKKWRGTRNLSQICATALRQELEAADSARTSQGLKALLRRKSREEEDLARTFRLVDACVVDSPRELADLRSALGHGGAEYLNRWLCDEARIAIAGGRQIWEVVRQLSPRSIRIGITALGVAQNDPRVLHVHPNTLTTILWLLYSPSATAQLVPTPNQGSLWPDNQPSAARPLYFVLSSCSPFLPNSPFATLLGDEIRGRLLDRGVSGDFAYIFFSTEGQVVEFPDIDPHAALGHSVLSARSLQRLTSRADARVILVAGGKDKLGTMLNVFRHRLCNVLITDRDSAMALLNAKSSEDP